jgi:hypothetical protein
MIAVLAGVVLIAAAKGDELFAVGVGLVAFAGALAGAAASLLRRAEVVRRAAPRSVDEAVARPSKELELISGRIGSLGQVTTPGGVVAAIYEAEVHATGTDGNGRGPLLGQERGEARRVTLRGEHVEVPVEVESSSLLAPVRARRCPLTPSLTLLDTEPQLVEGALATEGVSFERAAKQGEPCLVVGEMRGDTLVGGVSGPVLILLGDDRARAARLLARQAWRRVSAAVPLLALGAYLLSR